MITYNYERVMLSRSDKKAEVRDTYRTRIQFANGWAVSFVAAADEAGRTIYSECCRNTSETLPRADGVSVFATGEFKRVEVAIMNPQNELVPFQSGDTVKGWVAAQELLGIMKWVSEQPNA